MHCSSLCAMSILFVFTSNGHNWQAVIGIIGAAVLGVHHKLTVMRTSCILSILFVIN